MKKIWKRAAAAAVAAATLLLGSVPAMAEIGYTYAYDYWGDVQYSPDAYKVVDVFTSASFGLDKKLVSPQGLYVSGDMIYICDTGNNRILELRRVDEDSIELVREITEIKGDVEVTTFNGPTDIAISEDGYFFIADKNNNRILKVDQDLNYELEFTQPKGKNFDQTTSFLPSKISVDTAGRVYCIATNANKGLIKYENDGTFSGYVGATPVTYDWTDYIWKKLATKEQRAAMESFVPTEYDNLYMDHEGFIYVCTTHVKEADLDTGAANPVRKLNLMGDDILVRNGEWYVIGDLYWGSGGGYEGPSLLCDITTMENDVYFTLDKTRGRIFAYDDQGRLLYCFGGPGNMDGYFKQPTAIDHMGHDLIVLDALDNSITLFTPTTYGAKIFDAIEQFQDGLYEESGESWKEVMRDNGNYDLAYIGIGRSLLRQKKFYEALDYFRLKMDEDNYSKAFKQYRKEWVEDHIMEIILVILAVTCIPLAIGKIRRIKEEIDRADIFRTDRRQR